MIGKTLVHYEITAEIGRGGMGEVYQAKDTKLGRDVAIKVLPEEFALDTDRVARFQREAKLLASLNHPNIAAIYGLEEFEGTHFLVMELIEGDTLRDRIKSGPIQVEEALKLALQMAEALEAAHEKGVIHRDLKPANIKVTPDGKVKVLDFGLAKAYAGDQENLSPMDSPTISAAATQQGLILGTAAYMSPEQARGKPVDKRADIWAFGVVLFEMLTGQAAFQGEDVSVTLASVIKSDVNLTLLPPSIHPRVREVVNRCLQKEPKKRYSGISDAQYEIEQVLSDKSGVFVHSVTTVKPRKKLRLGIPWVVAAIVFTAIVSGVAVWMLRPTETKQIMRFAHDYPEFLPNAMAINSTLAVSPDGFNIVYVANGQLYLKRAQELNARPIQGTDENPVNPFFSPDGEWIGYFSDNQVKKISIMGGISVPLCELNRADGATWGSDNMIVFGQLGGVMRVSANGGATEEIVEEENCQFHCPQILPDGETILFTVQEGGKLQVAVQSLKSGERKNLFAGGPAQYIPTGHIVYGLENDLFAIPFNLDSLSTSGAGSPMVEDVFRLMPFLPTHSAISGSGTLIYVSGSTPLSNIFTQQRTLVWVDREGREELISAEPRDYGSPKISPDGTRIAFAIESENNEDIWIWDLFRENLKRLTTDDYANEALLWTPDGKRIVFLSGSGEIKWKAADGTGEVEQFASVPDRTIIPSSWSSDGKTLITWTHHPETKDIGLLSIEDASEWRTLLKEDFEELLPKISPDGRWMAYVTDETGEYQVYVRPFPDVDKGKEQVSTSGGSSPLWSPDGRELFYRNGESVMVVTVETDPELRFGTPKELFSGAYDSRAEADFSRQTMWDIHPDGKRFLMMKPLETTGDEPAEETPRKINIVLNWFEELKQRVPVE